MAADTAGNLYVVGCFTGTVNFDTDPGKSDLHTSYGGSNDNYSDAYLSKFDANGNFQCGGNWGQVGIRD